MEHPEKITVKQTLQCLWELGCLAVNEAFIAMDDALDVWGDDE